MTALLYMLSCAVLRADVTLLTMTIRRIPQSEAEALLRRREASA